MSLFLKLKDSKTNLPNLTKISEIYQVSLESKYRTIRYVRKYTKWYRYCGCIQSATGELPITAELVHKALVRQYQFTRELRYT